MAYIDPVIGLVTIPVGEFSRQWDLQGPSGVAVRTEVSAQSGTADVTPLFALWVVTPPEQSGSLPTLAGIDPLCKGSENPQHTQIIFWRSLRKIYLNSYLTSLTGLICSIVVHLAP
ncbi:MAG: hypothetical protein U9N80_07020 [Chloroflexota bacterium]|nr:hypothetical protein [Chloroflexota bacterium]